MDFSKLTPYHLEIICFIGQYFGTKNEYFEQLFNLKPWLMSDIEPPFQPLLERKRVPHLAQEFYNEHAYKEMISVLGKTLIKN